MILLLKNWGLKNFGFDIIDLGTGVSTKKLVNAVRRYILDILGMAILLTITMLGMRDVIKALEKKDLHG